MSPRKLTENDKQEILEQYRTSQATTSTLAKSYEVSSSTISRFLKNKLSSVEYEDLIQQKRLARTPRGEKSAKKTKDSTKKTKTKAQSKRKSDKAKSKPEEVDAVAIDVVVDNEAASTQVPQEVPEIAIATQESELESKPTTVPRRRRRRSAAASESVPETITQVESPTPQLEAKKATNKLVLDKKVANLDESEASTSDKPSLTLKEDTKPDKTSSPLKDSLRVAQVDRDTPSAERNPVESDNSPLSQRLILKTDRVEPEPEDDEDDVDLITLKEMLGEDLEDFNDDDDDEDEDDWEEEDISYRTGSSLSDLKILPLSQASFPRTCYLVIDRAAELIVKPLSEFADLGMIPTEENREKTLPVFDNHRIAKRFSHRRERIIKVPDGRMLQKTSRYLQDKGITRLLIDGQIYSLIN